MTDTPRLSVLITAYNRERYIAAAIESVLAQTCGDFELLIVDDHSADASVDIARDYAGRDARIRVLVNESHLGQFANRNAAASSARGEFLKYHDSDDVMYPYALAAMLGPLRAEPRAAFVLSNGVSWPGGPCPMLLTPRLSYQREFLGQGLFMCGPSGALFRTAAFRALGGFPERGVGSDYLFWLSACARVDVLLVPADLFWYRTHGEQEFSSEYAARDYAIIPGACWEALCAPTCPLTPSEVEQAKRNLVYSMLKLTYRDVRRGRWAVVRHRLRHARLSRRDWLRYLRPPRRDPFAGTPRDADGNFIIPDWSMYRMPPSSHPEPRS
jgi:glycosyltransferase involved in cell wall biosynthesis